MTLPLEMNDLSEIDALLQQGVAAHQQKRFEDAERCYRAIIQSQPTKSSFLATALGGSDYQDRLKALPAPPSSSENACLPGY